MDEDGYICLTDFGLAKILEGNEMAQSFCGTPEYLAPEILNEVGHAFPVDWWALGILTYEMIVGFPPFYTGSSNNNKMYELIKTKAVFSLMLQSTESKCLISAKTLSINVCLRIQRSALVIKMMSRK